MIFLAAVVPDRQDPAHTPYVSTALGPYDPAETDAIQRGRDWLRDVYATEDIRTLDLEPCYQDPTDARSLLLNGIEREARIRRHRLERERAEAAMAAVGAEVWALGERSFRHYHAVAVTLTVGPPDDLDPIILALGLRLEDV